MASTFSNLEVIMESILLKILLPRLFDIVVDVIKEKVEDTDSKIDDTVLAGLEEHKEEIVGAAKAGVNKRLKKIRKKK